MSKSVSEIMNRPVSEFMSTKLVTVIPTDGLEKVKEIFETYNIHHIPVVRFTDLVGMISKTDFYKAIHGLRLHDASQARSENKALLTKYKVEDLMTKHIARVSPEDKVGVAAEIFLENYFHAIPVVNADGELKGIITNYDVIKAFFHVAYPSQELNKMV